MQQSALQEERFFESYLYQQPAPAFQTIRFLGLPIYADSLEAATDYLAADVPCSARRSLLVSATGAHGLTYAAQHEAFAGTLRRFAFLLPDGMPLVWVGHLKGVKGMERCYGPTVFQQVLEKSAFHDVKHYFCGGKPGIAEDLKKTARTLFHNDHCVGTYSPPFRKMAEDEWNELAASIAESGADIVWIGLSTPKQEAFAAELAKRVTVRFIVTIGAAFDFHSGKVVQAPYWVQQSGLEWLFRLMVEPRRLFRRYVVVVPWFIQLAVKDLWHFHVAHGRG